MSRLWGKDQYRRRSAICYTCSYENFRTRIPGHGITFNDRSRCKLF